MRLLLDEMLSPQIARQLAERGRDVKAIKGTPGWEALSDPEVLALARRKQRAVVTNNVADFRPLHHEAVTPGGPGHFGMIFLPGAFRRSKADTGRIVEALDDLLAQHPSIDSLSSGEVWLNGA